MSPNQAKRNYGARTLVLEDFALKFTGSSCRKREFATYLTMGAYVIRHKRRQCGIPAELQTQEEADHPALLRRTSLQSRMVRAV